MITCQQNRQNIDKIKIMKRIITIISAATTVLAFYNEARKTGLVEDLVAKYLPSNRSLDSDYDE